MKPLRGPSDPFGVRFSIREAKNPKEFEVARALFREYRTWLATHRGVTDFPDPVLARGLRLFDAEIASLPGEYAPPAGALFLAFQNAEPIGCAALRRIASGTVEFKRLFVRPRGRKAGVGRRLTVRAIRRAREMGYRRVVLDTLPRMDRAIALYRKLGFQAIPPYWANPVPGALFFQLALLDGPVRAPRDRSRPRRVTRSQRLTQPRNGSPEPRF